MKFCVVLAFLLVVSDSSKTGIKNKVKPHVVCEACQSVVYDIIPKLKKQPPSAAGLDVQIMGLLENECNQLNEYAGKADIQPSEFTEACQYLMENGLEEGLEDSLNKNSNEQKLREKLCTRKVQKVKICEKLWTEAELPANRLSPGERNLAAAQKFLSANKEKEGVVVLPSGVQYKVLQKGTGKISPSANEQVVCHYAGRLENGEEFDSSYSRGTPAEFAPSGVIKAWTEALQLMVKGDIWELYVHPDMGYGERGSPPKIGPSALLIFKIEVLGVKGKDDDATLAAAAKKVSDDARDEADTAQEGLMQKMDL